MGFNGIYRLVMTNSLQLKIAIESSWIYMDLPSYKMVNLSIVFCRRLPGRLVEFLLL